MTNIFKKYEDSEYFIEQIVGFGTPTFRERPRLLKVDVVKSSRISKITRLIIWTSYVLLMITGGLMFLSISLSIIFGDEVAAIIIFPITFLFSLFFFLSAYTFAPLLLFLYKIQFKKYSNLNEWYKTPNR
jgi:hypothetical protein